MDTILEVGLDLLATVLIGLLGLLASYVLYQIGQATASLKAKTANEYIDAVIDRLYLLTVTAVESTEAESAKFIRESVKAGRIASAEGRQELILLGKETTQRIKAELGDKSIELLQEQRVDIDAMIKDMLEAAVERIKGPLSDGSGEPEQTAS